MLFGANVKYLRSVRGMTQAELGETLGVKGATVTGWETGKSSPHFEVLLKLRDFFKVDLESLVYQDLQHGARENKHSGVDTQDGIMSLVTLLFDQLKEKIEALENRMERIESRA